MDVDVCDKCGVNVPKLTADGTFRFLKDCYLHHE